MSFYHRQPHPDLPAIPEESNEASTPNPNDVTPVKEIDIDDDDGVDDSSNAESYANSYAFTLGNVGFDEEDSLVGSVVGSVIGGMGGGAVASAATTAVEGGALLETPSSQYSQDRTPRRERTLHGETCRTLGLPYSEDAPSSSPRSGSGHSLLKESSALGSISVSSGSVDEFDRERKMDAMWPWPTAVTESGPHAVTLEKIKSNVNNADGKQSTMLRTSETTSSYTIQMKDAFSSFNKRIEEAYFQANAKQNSTTNIDEKRQTPNDCDKENGSAASKRPKTGRGPLQLGWVTSYKNSYKDANPLTRLTICTIVLFMILCIIVMLTMIRVSKQGLRTKIYNDGPDVTAIEGDNLTPMIPKTNDVGDINLSSPSVFAVAMGAAPNTTGPTSTPTYTPTASPFKVITTAAADNRDTVKEGCVNGQGKFKNMQGKHRKCDWLITHNSEELRTKRLDAECGKPGPSELGSNCLYACRAYNGCIQQGSGINAVQAGPEMRFPSDSLTNSPTMKPTSGPIVDASKQESTIIANFPTFIDIRGRERQCWWLDIRNQHQKRIRRDANCVKVQVQVACPSSCSAYFVMAVAKRNTANDGGGDIKSSSLSVSAVAVAAAADTTGPTSVPNFSPTASPVKVIPVLANNANPMKEGCVDGQGKFKNTKGKHRKCDWLIMHDSEELRSERLDAECSEPGPSELGLNCLHACRAYNGCSQQPGEAADAERAKQDKVIGVDPVRAGPEMRFPIDSSINSLMVKSTSGLVDSSEQESTTAAEFSTFFDIRGRRRQCWWLDIRSARQKQVRRDANCVKAEVRARCPSSCSAYFGMAVVRSNAMSQAGNFASADDSTKNKSGNEGNDEEEDAMASTIAPQPLQIDEIIPPQLIYEHHHDPLPQDTCVDGHGYYLNHHGKPKQCAWLINSLDPTDEARRMRNCGYHGSEHSDGTDLGRMCKSTCGTCDL